MKLRNLFFGMGVLTVMAACESTPKGYVVNGEISSTTEGTVYLKRVEDKTFSITDSAQIVNGKFMLQGLLPNGVEAYGLTTSRTDNSPLLFFLENGKLNVSIDEESKQIIVEGSESDVFFRKVVEYSKQDGFQIDTLVAHHPDSPVAAYLLMKSYSWGFDTQGLKALRSQMTPALENSFYVEQLNDLISRKEKVDVGQMAPEITLPDPDGNLQSLSSLRGKYVLLDFWASWCPDCRREIPEVVNAYQKLKDQNFTIFSVSLDRAKDPWVKAIEQYELNWTHVSELKYWQSEVVNQYAIRWIPAYFLLDPEGRILSVSLDSDGLVKSLKDTFGEY